METILIVSGGDSKYFDLLSELLLSLRRIPNGDKYNLAFLDGGLLANQKLFFTNNGVVVVDPGWRHPLAEKRCRGRNHLKINIAKLHLDKIFPTYKTIIWLDGDTWLQNDQAIKLLTMVAKKNKFAIVSQASRLQDKHIEFRSWIFGLVSLRNILYKNAKRAGLPPSIIKKLQAKPTLNAGSYALSVDAPHWERFRFWQDIALKKGRLFTSDQLAMGLTVYEDKMPFEALPDICNYMGPWRWCTKRKLFIDYFAPYDPVSVVHLAGQDHMRVDDKYVIEIHDEDDNKIKKSLRYSSIY